MIEINETTDRRHFVNATIDGKPKSGDFEEREEVV